MAQAVTSSALLEQARALCHGHDATLLFLTVFGSTLYGTAMPGRSDVDVRGVFMPSPASLLLNRAPRSLHVSTGDQARRNLASDVDVDLWSVQHWLLELLPAGDMGALDLLFSPSNPACTLYRHPALDAVFANPLRLLNTAGGNAYAEYSLKQAKKYGIRGSHAGALKAVRAWLRTHCPRPEPNERLARHLEALVAECGDGRFCSLVNIEGEPALQLCGKRHLASVRMDELIRRVEEDTRRHAPHLEDADAGRGVDFKALSHALRALDQMEELLRTGTIVFPLRSREALMAVKRGEYSWPQVETRLLERLDAVNTLREKAAFAGCHDAAFAEACVLSCYQPDFFGRQQPGRGTTMAGHVHAENACQQHEPS